MNLDTGELLSLTGDYAEDNGTADGTTSALYLATWSAAGGKLPGAIAEFTTAGVLKTNLELVPFFAYARRRYAGVS